MCLIHWETGLIPLIVHVWSATSLIVIKSEDSHIFSFGGFFGFTGKSNEGLLEVLDTSLLPAPQQTLHQRTELLQTSHSDVCGCDVLCPPEGFTDHLLGSYSLPEVGTQLNPGKGSREDVYWESVEAVSYKPQLLNPLSELPSRSGLEQPQNRIGAAQSAQTVNIAVQITGAPLPSI